MPLLTKSKYLLGLQCPKCLWVAINDKTKIPEPDESLQHIFDQGHLVGELAKKNFPGGIDIDAEDFIGNVDKTKELLKKRKTLFEAGIMIDNIYSRADVLKPVGKNEWDIIEVKSSTQVKEVNIHDVSFQKHCYKKYGLKIRKCFLMAINNQYVRQGPIDAKHLFVLHDITEEVNSAIIGIQERIEEMFKIISSDLAPDINIGKHCANPYPCSLTDDCWKFLPKNNVFNLYRGGKKSVELFESEVLEIKDIPEHFDLNEKQRIQLKCAKSGKCHINKEEINKFLEALEYPLYYLDFETYATAVPLYDGLRPYQPIPFQFSLHIQKSKGSKPEHYSFLAEGDKDPRKEFVSKLKEVLGDKGSIVVYNQSFEIGCLKELAKLFPEYEEWVESTVKRVVDLLVPFRSFHYHHPKQEGSASIKKVLPAVTGKSYDGMEIAQGDIASLRYLYITHGGVNGAEAKVKSEEVTKVRKDLEKYCKLDTEGMVWIVGKLEEL